MSQLRLSREPHSTVPRSQIISPGRDLACLFRLGEQLCRRGEALLRLPFKEELAAPARKVVSCQPPAANPLSLPPLLSQGHILLGVAPANDCDSTRLW